MFIDLKSFKGILDENMYYMVSMYTGFVFCINCDTGDISVIENIPPNYPIGKNSFSGICKCGDKLVLIPLLANDIWMYDLNNNMWQSISLPTKVRNITNKFFDCCVYSNYIYMFGHYYSGIIKLNIEDLSIKEIEVTFDSDDIERSFFNYNSYIIGSYLYIPSCQTNCVVKIRLKDDSYELIYLGSGHEGFSGMTFDGEEFWLSPRKNGPIIRWNGDKKVEEFILPKEFERKDFYFGSAVNCENYILFAGFSNLSVIIDLNQNKKMTVLNKGFAHTYKSNDQKIVLQDDEGLYLIDKMKKQKICSNFISDDKLVISEEFKGKYGGYFDASIINEQNGYTLNDFISIIV